MPPTRCEFCLNVVNESGRHVDGYAEHGMNMPDPGDDPDFCRKVMRSQLRDARAAYQSIFASWALAQEQYATRVRLASAEQARLAIGEPTTPFRG